MQDFRLSLFAFAMGLFALVPAANLHSQELAIVPQPTTVLSVAGEPFRIPEVIEISVPDIDTWRKHLQICSASLQRVTDGKYRVEFAPTEQADFIIQKDEELELEEYSIFISEKQRSIRASSLKGLSRATATLMQIIGSTEDGAIPGVVIRDATRVSYRNLMIDMGRNPHSFELLKETIDLLWFYKVDSLQLHLTDDQRFAFPSTKFPTLWDGLITLEQFRQLEEYALLRGVTIIPEFEVPGHSEKLRGIYPEVFGKTPTDLASTETALAGIKTILEEMMDVFPSSPYIHVGGDEAFGVPEELQRDLINKLHAWLKSKGKQTIVWEGPRSGKAENKVNEEVIHINWRTINYPADQMLADGYRVINAAWDPLYIVDHYPRTNFTMTSPQHIYETLSLTRFKHVNPGIPTFSRPQQVSPNDKLIGFCMPWWEGREKNFMPQVVPRMIPFAEIAWNPEMERNSEDFLRRVQQTETIRKKMFYPVKIKASNLAVPYDGVFHDSSSISLSVEDGGRKDKPSIHYTLDGTTPTSGSPTYDKPFRITEDTTVRAITIRNGKTVSHGSRANFKHVEPVDNLALGRPVTTSVTTGPPFSIQRITDGGTGNLDFYLGYPAEPMPIEITIDLESVQKVSSVSVVAYTISGSWEKYAVETSVDGKSFDEVAKRLEKPGKVEPAVEHKFEPRDVRYVRVRSHGNKGYVFDSFSKIVEVQVR